jgi:hypothetical protein
LGTRKQVILLVPVQVPELAAAVARVLVRGAVRLRLLFQEPGPVREWALMWLAAGPVLELGQAVPGEGVPEAELLYH